MYRKSAVEDSGFYDDYRFFEDYNLWVAMLMKGHKGYNVQENLLVHEGRSGYVQETWRIRLY